MKKKLGFGIILAVIFVMVLGMTSLAAGNTKTIKNKKWVSGKGGQFIDSDKDGMADKFKSNGKAYYKFTVPKQGYIIIEAKGSKLPRTDEYYTMLYGPDGLGDTSELHVSLLNSSKKKIYGEENYASDKNIKYSAAVKKGTYYLEVHGEQAYKMRYTFTAVGKLSKVGKDAKSAVVLKKGVTVKNMLRSTKEDHYYKFDLPKKAKINISVLCKIAGDDNMIITLYMKKGKEYKMITDKGKLVKKGSIVFWQFQDEKGVIKATLPKGSYGIRVGTFDPTGYYTLKWN